MTSTIRTVFSAAALLACCALLAAFLLTGTEHLTRQRITEARHAAELAALAMVLPASGYDNDPLIDSVSVHAPHWLGGDQATVHRARRGTTPTGLAIEAIAPDGYSGPIRLLVGVDAGGRVLGVRIVEHRETPGLGDAIDAARSQWIQSFDGRSLIDPPLPRWTVRKHGGSFDHFAGATISPRAVVHAVRRVLQYVDRHGVELYAADVGSPLQHDDRPD